MKENVTMRHARCTHILTSLLFTITPTFEVAAFKEVSLPTFCKHFSSLFNTGIQPIPKSCIKTLPAIRCNASHYSDANLAEISVKSTYLVIGASLRNDIVWFTDGYQGFGDLLVRFQFII